jgi:hypothetical protein
MNTQQPEALRLANELDAYHTAPHHKQAAAELCRLYGLAQEQHTEIYGLRLKVRNLHSVNADLLKALEDIVEGSTDQGAIECASDAIAKARGVA